MDFYDDKAKTFYRVFSAIKNFHITLYRSDVSEQFYIGEHMEFWYSIQFCSGNFDGIWMKCFALVSA